MRKCYSDLLRLESYEERVKYLQTAQRIGERSFGGDRYLNQTFYRSTEWKNFRYKIILRDQACDLALLNRLIPRGHVHHINPITLDELRHGDECLFDPENVILCSQATHNLIHFGRESSIPKELVERRPGDTCPWK